MAPSRHVYPLRDPAGLNEATCVERIDIRGSDFAGQGAGSGFVKNLVSLDYVGLPQALDRRAKNEDE